MTKAKTIDRLELTRKKFSRQATGNLNSEQSQVVTAHEEDNSKLQANEEHYELSTCPNCGQMTLIHEGGCEHCSNCSYSRCG